MNWFRQLFTPPKKETTDMKKFLIVGLGNIGAEYVNTRHNIGFKILDFLARKEGVEFETVKLGALAQYKFKGRTFLLFLYKYILLLLSRYCLLNCNTNFRNRLS